ncbi:MAG TPA: class I SAM-dependent methyltransferase [Ferruginibacter sp.]|nr:class I SAM-dependent methyltransferase [Ferruginibacter sp.]
MKKYSFEEIINCEMCGNATANHAILGQRLNQSQGLNPKNKSGISVSIKKCNNCELIYSSPLPVPENIQDHYGIPPEDYWRPAYFISNPVYFSSEIAIIKKLLPYKEGRKVLDIGAGIGHAMLALEREGFDVYGFEPSEPFYKKAIAVMNIKPERLKLGMIENMEYEENTFDVITIGAVFEHLYHPSACLKKALSWLKPGGLIYIEVPSSNYFISKLINFYYYIRGTNYVTNISPMHSPFHLYEFSPKSFSILEDKMNFKIERIDHHVCDIAFIPKIFHPIFKKYMQITNTGMQISVYLRKK